MNEEEESLENLRAIFEKNKELYIAVFQYGITHGALVLALYTTNFMKRIEVQCIGTYFF